MPTLKNAKHELYAQGLAAGLTADRAYVQAGYRANRGNASELKAKPHIQARLSELLAATAVTVPITRDQLLAQLQRDHDFAVQRGQIGAAITATMGLAKILGHIVDRAAVQTTMKRIEDMTEDELRAFIGLQGDPA